MVAGTQHRTKVRQWGGSLFSDPCRKQRRIRDDKGGQEGCAGNLDQAGNRFILLFNFNKILRTAIFFLVFGCILVVVERLRSAMIVVMLRWVVVAFLLCRQFTVVVQAMKATAEGTGETYHGIQAENHNKHQGFKICSFRPLHESKQNYRFLPNPAGN